jgi:hypothetical protein
MNTEAKNKLIDKIAMQADALFRAHLAEIISDLDEIAAEISKPKMAVTLKVKITRGRGYTFDTKITWKGNNDKNDATDAETVDIDTPDMFDRAEDERNKSGFQKIADENNVEISIGVNGEKPVVIAKPKGRKKKDAMKVDKTLKTETPPCDEVVTGTEETGCCQCEKPECDLRIAPFGAAGACEQVAACSKNCPRYKK